MTSHLQSRDGSDEEAGQLGRVAELEQRLLEAKLRQQQLQSEADSRWLHQEENNLVRHKYFFVIIKYFYDRLLAEEATVDHTIVRV